MGAAKLCGIPATQDIHFLIELNQGLSSFGTQLGDNTRFLCSLKVMRESCDLCLRLSVNGPSCKSHLVLGRSHPGKKFLIFRKLRPEALTEPRTFSAYDKVP